MTTVIQWGTGAVGRHAIRFVLQSRDLQLVGVKCFTKDKAGRDAGELAGVAPTGIPATLDVDQLLSIPADVVLYMPRDTFLDPTLPGSPSAAWVDEVVMLLETGRNVVSPLQSAMHWRQLAHGDRLRYRLAAACELGGASLYFTGLDPGFVSDCLAITLSSAAGEITTVRTLEVIDYATYGSAETLESMGFGRIPSGVDGETDESLVPSWGCALWLVADALGIELDDILLTATHALSPNDFTTPGGLHLSTGTVAGMLWKISGVVNGRPLIECRHVARAGAHIAPDWPHIGERGGYRVEIEGSPPLRLELPLGLEGGTGTCLGDAVMMTAARCVNAIDAVVSAAPGYLLFNDLPTVGGRHGLSASVVATATRS